MRRASVFPGEPPAGWQPQGADLEEVSRFTLQGPDEFVQRHERHVLAGTLEPVHGGAADPQGSRHLALRETGLSSEVSERVRKPCREVHAS